MKRDAIDLSKSNVYALFCKYFFPTLMGMLGMSAVTAIDGIFIGHGVGSQGIAAVNICIPLLMILTGVGLMVGMGCSVVASVHLARGKAKAACINVTQAMIFSSLVALVPTVIVVSAPEAAAMIMGSSRTLLPLVTDYMVWFAPSWVFNMWIAVGLLVIRLDGSPRYAMMCSLSAGALNVVLDWLMIFPMGMGVKGASIASTISIIVGGLMVIAYLTRFSTQIKFYRLKMSAKSLRLTLRNIGYQCRIGSSALLGESTLAVLMYMGNRTFMHYLGDDGVGAFGITCYYAPFIFMIGNAVAQSAQPIISYNHGLGLRRRVSQATSIAIAAAVACGVIVASAFTLCPRLLVGLFLDLGSNAAVIAVEGLPLFATGLVFFIFNVTMVGYYQSVERPLPATIFATLRGLVLLVPAFMIMPHVMGNDGIWMAMPVSEALTAVTIVAYAAVRHHPHLNRGMRRQKS